MITDFETFMMDEGYDRIFRMLEKRTPGDWTPREVSEKYIDQDHYVDNHYSHIKIVETIELPNKEILLGFKRICEGKDLEDDTFQKLPIEYRMLSQLELCFYPEDMDEDAWE